MQKVRLKVILLVSFFLIFNCAQDKIEKQDILATINDRNIYIHEFEDQLIETLDSDNDIAFSREKKREILEQMIRKELLLKEAERLKLDQKDSFLRAVERYSEAILIKELVELKNEEFKQSVNISNEEIKAEYNSLKETNKNIALLKELEPKIADEIKEQKTREKFKEWMKELREKADININEELIK